MMPELILHGGKITTLDAAKPQAQALAIQGGRIVAVGDDDQILPLSGAATQVVNLQGRRVIPGLNDSHLHVIRAPGCSTTWNFAGTASPACLRPWPNFVTRPRTRR